MSKIPCWQASLALALSIASPTSHALSVDITALSLIQYSLAEGTFHGRTVDMGLAQSTGVFFGNPWALAAVAYFELGTAPLMDNETATDSANISNGLQVTTFDLGLLGGKAS